MRTLGRHAKFVLIVISLLAICPQDSVAKPPQPSSSKKKSEYSIDSFSKYVEVAGATRVGVDTCAQCHPEVAGSFRHAFHAQQGVECEDCHGAGSLHVEGSGDVAKIISFGSRPAKDANGVCLSCHAQHEKVRNWLAGRHAAHGVRCTDCHQVHAPQAGGTTQPRMSFDTLAPGHETFVERFVPESSVKFERRSATNDACLKCHAAQRAQMSLPYHHPLREGKVTCVDCHDPHGGPAGNNLRMANTNQLCLSCHAQYRGPFMYQHPPVNESCLICHTPHGSPNTNLLTVSLPALCLQCHAGHHDGASLPLVDRCTNCHGSIHGSDVPTPTGGSRFVDKGGLGVPGFAQPASVAGLRRRRAYVPVRPARAHVAIPSGIPGSHLMAVSPPPGGLNAGYISPVASHRAVALAPMGALAGGLGAMFAAFPGAMSGGAGLPAAGAMATDSDLALYFAPGAYRFLHVTGYGGRVGEYDSLQEAEGGDLEADYVSPAHHLSFLTRGTVLTGSDFDMKSRLTVGDTLEVGGDLRSFVEQQDNYPFYAGVISPDITNAAGVQSLYDGIPSGSVFGVKRRIGSAYARLKLPKVPVHLFVKGGWQARVGHTQLGYLDENIDATCSTCHFTS